MSSSAAYFSPLPALSALPLDADGRTLDVDDDDSQSSALLASLNDPANNPHSAAAIRHLSIHPTGPRAHGGGLAALGGIGHHNGSTTGNGQEDDDDDTEPDMIAMLNAQSSRFVPPSFPHRVPPPTFGALPPPSGQWGGLGFGGGGGSASTGNGNGNGTGGGSTLPLGSFGGSPLSEHDYSVEADDMHMHMGAGVMGMGMMGSMDVGVPFAFGGGRLPLLDGELAESLLSDFRVITTIYEEADEEAYDTEDDEDDEDDDDEEDDGECAEGDAEAAEDANGQVIEGSQPSSGIGQESTPAASSPDQIGSE